jgi:hypothetical protein
MAIAPQVRDEQLEQAKHALAWRGVHPDEAGMYSEEALRASVEARGLKLVIEGEPGDWSAEVVEEGGDPDWPFGEGHDADRITALVRSVGRAATVLTRDEARKHFDETVQNRLGMDADEFRRRWDAGEFSPDDENYWVAESLSMMSAFGRV